MHTHTVYMYIYIYIYIHTHTHTHTHIYIYAYIYIYICLTARLTARFGALALADGRRLRGGESAQGRVCIHESLQLKVPCSY